MKKTLKIMAVALLALGLFACGEKHKITVEELREAQSTLFNENGRLNEKEAPGVAEKYLKYVDQNPNDTAVVKWLFHAMEINVLLKDADQSEKLCNQLLEQFPESRWAPQALLTLGSYVYNDQLNDTAKAHAAFQRLIDEYPESDLVDDAQKSIEYLGLTPEEIMTLIMMSKMEVEEFDSDL
jgi:outer membrane protein assembly factor BamD (BamD/ComL family)